jgi:hypothetical protein
MIVNGEQIGIWNDELVSYSRNFSERRRKALTVSVRRLQFACDSKLEIQNMNLELYLLSFWKKGAD